MSTSRERGMSLVLALLLVAAAALFALTAAARSRDLAMDEVRDRATMQARWAAEGAVERARWALARDPAYAGETCDVGATSVEIRIESSHGTASRVTAIATTSAAPFAETITQQLATDLIGRRAALPRVAAWHE